MIGSGDGGAHATPRDLDRFLRAIASRRPPRRRRERPDAQPPRPRRRRVWYGYGLYVRADGGFGHGGGDPGIETVARHIPDRDLTVVALCNGEGTLNEVWPLVLSAL